MQSLILQFMALMLLASSGAEAADGSQPRGHQIIADDDCGSEGAECPPSEVVLHYHTQSEAGLGLPAPRLLEMCRQS
jgi:hypothetical protein